jgi:hypothetical protein
MNAKVHERKTENAKDTIETQKDKSWAVGIFKF